MEQSEHHPKWLYQFLATLAGSLSIVTCGLQFGWTSPSLIKLQAEDSPVPITSDQGSWIAVSIFLGTLVGGITINPLTRILTKRQVVLLAAVPFIISWLIIAFARSFPLLIVARIMGGVPDALVYGIVPLFLAEVASTRVRGLIMTFIPLSGAFGYLLINIVGSYTTIQTTALISAVFPILFFTLFTVIPDSPYDLLQRNELDAAKKCLKRFSGVSDVEDDFNRIQKAFRADAASDSGSIIDLVKVASNRRALIILFVVRGIHQLSGITAINFYSQSIFQQIGGDVSPAILSSIYFLMPIFSTMLSLCVVDRLGRIPLMIFATVIVSIALFTLGTVSYLNTDNQIDHGTYAIVSSSALIVYIIVFYLGIQSAPVILVGELFPSHLKAYATSAHEIYFCILTTVVTKYFHFTSNRIGLYVPFFTFAVFSFLGLFFIVFFVPETKRKTLEEIQDLLKRKDTINRNYGTIK